MILIKESNEDIDRLSQYLSSKVVELRRKYPNSKVLEDAKELYDNVITPWMENYWLSHNEIDREYDEQLKNILLEWITKINEVLNK